MVNNLEKRVSRIESIAPPVRERTKWLCARIPANPDASKIKALEVQAVAAGMQLDLYQYEGKIDPWEQMPEYYAAHSLEAVPGIYKTQCVREARMQRI